MWTRERRQTANSPGQSRLGVASVSACCGKRIVQFRNSWRFPPVSGLAPYASGPSFALPRYPMLFRCFRSETLIGIFIFKSPIKNKLNNLSEQ
ncbi:hypothetical protein, partial [Paraburkholderia caledonica]|uniref:hypothetical protein n=1 Tax=Paraburkholderia caledonica TaxID=134536 RepID=UPI003CA8599B